MKLQSVIQTVPLIILVLFLWCGSAFGLTKQIMADYSNQSGEHISHYVVVQKNRATLHQVRLELPFFQACVSGTCTMSLDLAPDTEYEFSVFFKNAAGDGGSRQLVYKTGKAGLFEKNPPQYEAVAGLGKIILLSPADNAILHHDTAAGIIPFMFTKVSETSRYVLYLSLYHTQTGTTLPLDIELIPGQGTGPGADNPGLFSNPPLPTPDFFEKSPAMVYEPLLDAWIWQVLAQFDIHWWVEAFDAGGELIGTSMLEPYPGKQANRLFLY